MKKIIYMLTTMFYPSIGGVENHIYNLSLEFLKEGYIVKVIKPEINSENEGIEVLDGIEIHRLKVGNLEDLKKYENLKSKTNGSLISFIYGYRRKSFYNKYSEKVFKYIENIIENDNSEEFIIHQHDFISSIKLSRKLSRKYKIIFTNHTGEFLFLKKIPFNKMIIKLLTKHFNFIIAPSNELADFKGILTDDKYKYIPNGVNLEKFNKVSRRQQLILREKYMISKEKTIVICPRRWAPTKGIIYLVEAINLLENKNNKDFLFLFAGNEYNDYPEYKKKIIDFIKDNNLEENIMFLGNLSYDKMVESLQLSDIVVIPSLMEAVSLSALEAMACGKIIVASNIGGLKQIIFNNETGYLVNKGSSEEIANTLIEIINKKSEEKSEIQKKSIEFVEKNFSWSVIAKETEKIYTSFGINS